MLAKALLLAVFPAIVVASLSPQNSTFYLKTIASHSSVLWEHFDDLYLQGYHTGAGLAEAVLTRDKTDALAAYFDPMQGFVEFDHGSIGGLSMPQDAGTYDAWYFVEINLSGQSAKFCFSAAGLVYESPLFKGWMACDWWHGMPQLFWKNTVHTVATPPFCADVDLIPVPA